MSGEGYASQRYGGLVDSGHIRECRPQGPQPSMGAGSSHFSTVKSEKKWQRLYPDKKEFTEICSEKYPSYVVGNYKLKKNCFFITQPHNTIFLKIRMNTGF